MRLAILMSIASPWARETALNMARSGHQVHVIDFETPGAEQAYLNREDHFQEASIRAFEKSVDRVHLIRAPTLGAIRYWTSGIALRRILKNIEAESLLTLYGGGFALTAFLSGYRPYSVYVVGSDVLMATGIRKTLARISLSGARRVFANGDYLSERTKKLAPNAKVSSLLLGIDIQRFTSSPEPVSKLRIISTRGFLPVYNNEYIIQALAETDLRVGGWEAVFVSAGPDLDKAKTLANTILPEDLRKKVSFFGGVSPVDLLSSLQSASIYISVSRSDGTSTSLLEALACGLFPIVSDIPQNREWIFPDKGNGILVPLDQPAVLAGAIAKAIIGDEMRKRAAKFNRELVAKRANNSHNMSVLSAVLEEEYVN